jgi:cobalt-zinc-cadmium resistance protein CzcA
MRGAHLLYRPLFALALRAPRRTLAIALVPVVLGAFAFRFLGGEFMPHLEEGNFWIRATLPMSISLEQSAKYVGRMRAILLGCPESDAVCDPARRRHPEVVTVVSQLGRPVFKISSSSRRCGRSMNGPAV